MQLLQLRELVENGRTARWTFVPERSDKLYFIIRIKKVSDGAYIWQHKTINTADDTLVSMSTVAHPSWDVLYKDIQGDGSEGDQTVTGKWIITDDELAPYLPERKTAP